MKPLRACRWSCLLLTTHYYYFCRWNLRELSRVFQGLCMSQQEFYNEPFTMVRLWLHEVHRVYGDRLTNEQAMPDPTPLPSSPPHNLTPTPPV